MASLHPAVRDDALLAGVGRTRGYVQGQGELEIERARETKKFRELDLFRSRLGYYLLLFSSFWRCPQGGKFSPARGDEDEEADVAFIVIR